MSGEDCIIGYDADSDNGFVIEEDTSSIDAYDGTGCLSDNFSEEEEKCTTPASEGDDEDDNEIIYKNLKVKFSTVKKIKPTSYTIILQEEDDFI